MFLVFLKEIQVKWFLQKLYKFFFITTPRIPNSLPTAVFFPFEDKGRLYEAITKTFYKFISSILLVIMTIKFKRLEMYTS